MYKNKVRGHRGTEPLTTEEKDQILELTREGKLKRHEIARIFRVHPQTIKILCDANGLGRWATLTPEAEQQVVKLAREGLAVYRIAKAARLPGRVVREVMRKHKIVHKVGGGPKLPLKKRAEIAEAIRSRKDYLYRLAKQFGVSRGTIRTIAREVACVDRFIGWPNIEPMTPAPADLSGGYDKFMENIVRKTTSLEASVENFRKQMNEIYIGMIEKHIELWHSGQVPVDRDGFVSKLLEINLPKTLRGQGSLTVGQWDENRGMTENYIRTALDYVAGPRARWTN